MGASENRPSDKASQRPFMPAQQESDGKLALLIIGLLLAALAAYRFHAEPKQNAVCPDAGLAT